LCGILDIRLNKMQTFEYFKTPIYIEQKPEFVKSLNKASDKYIIDAKKLAKEYIKKYGDFGTSYHSTTLTMDNNFFRF
jgi:acetate kinase